MINDSTAPDGNDRLVSGNRHLLRYIPWWFPMLLIAVLNGIMREEWFRKHMNLTSAHQLSTISLIILFALYMALLFRNIRLRTASQALGVGTMWMVMTLLFEFGFGRWRGNSWETLLEDYNILKGHIWIFVPLWICMAPYFFYQYFTRHK